MKEFRESRRTSGSSSLVWRFEHTQIPMTQTFLMLVRILIAKVVSRRRLISVLETVPIRQGEAGWNCVEWVKEALAAMVADGKVLGTSVTRWRTVREASMRYAERKIAEGRFDSRTPAGGFDAWDPVATYDLIAGVES